jgi:NADPH2:quinone reductase
VTGAIRIKQFGGPEVLEWVDVEVGAPGPGQARVAHTAVGLNYLDTYFRSGAYPIKLPSGMGSEAAGTVVAVGEGVSELKPGDRVAYSAPPPTDAYAQERLIDVRWLVKLPAGISDETAAAMMLKGLTSWYLLKQTYHVQPGDWILLYAAAGGVGLIMSQWARHLGVRVIGVVSTPAKRDLALAKGCEEVLMSDSDIPSAVREITHGEGVPVVYDSVGRDTFTQSLDSLRRRGLMVSFGASSGPVPPFSVSDLAKRGSLFVTRPTLFDYIARAEDLRAGSAELFDVVAKGVVSVDINQRYALRDVVRAHQDLQARRTTGSTILLP